MLNVTPDSFSDGGEFSDHAAAVLRAQAILEEGARVVDVGGESTRPGSDPVSPEEEQSRVVPVIRDLVAARPGTLVSVDTYRASTAAAALDAGASIINDVTALRGDPKMAPLAAERGVPIVLMHMKGEPKTMQRDPRYGDVVREVREHLAGRAEHAMDAGVEERNIVLDPGIGFGKTLAHNLELLRRLDEIVALGFPVLVGASRKTFIGALTGVERPGDRVFGSVAANVLAHARGVSLFRVHDVRANAEALAVAEAVRGA